MRIPLSPVFQILGCALCLGALSAADDAPLFGNSLTLQPVFEQVEKAFEKAVPGASIQSLSGLSTDMIKRIGEGEAAAGLMVRAPKEAEKKTYPGLVAVPFCVDLLVIAVHQDNPVQNLTLAQVKDLFSGTAASWKAVGGADAPPVLVARIETFSSMEFFESSFGLTRVVTGEGADKRLAYAPGGPQVAAPSTNEKALAKVIANPQAVTFASLALVNEMRAKGVPIKAVALNGIEASDTTAHNGTYPVKRRFVIIKGSKVPERAQAFINFLTGPEGRAIVAAKGLIPLED